MQKENESLLGELTSNTNKEFFKTNKFVSDGYIDTYTIKSGKISLEFKKEKINELKTELSEFLK